MRLRRYISHGTIHWHNLYYDAMPKWAKDNAPPLGSYNYAAYFLKPWEYVEDVYLQAKWFYQRGSRGYADNSTWSIDWYLCGWMGKALRELADQVHGVPAQDVRLTPPEDPNDLWTLSMEEWKATIVYIAETFDLGHKIQDYDVPYEQMEAAMKRFHHGMAMFSEYFFNLWD